MIGWAIEVHRTPGPGLLESVYEARLCHEPGVARLAFVRQQRLPVIYKRRRLDCDLRMDIVVEDTVLPEIKSVHMPHPVHEAQLHTCLKHSGLRAGLLLNSNQARRVDGIRRRVP